MKKAILTLLLVVTGFVTFGQQWNAITSNTPNTIQKQLVASTEQSITVNVQVTGFYTDEVITPRGVANIISVPRTVSTAQAGEPNLPMIAIPAIIGDNQRYSIRVVDAQYQDFNINVAPSKGNFSREINPEDVPYTYGEAYNQDAFFPTNNIGLYEPYILRDFRGQNMVIYPFAYNPATQTLRVYHNMTVEMYCEGVGGENQITRKSNTVKMDPEFNALYDNQFINYQASLNRYTPIQEEGDLLIICHDAFMTAMQPFVNWKKQIGRPTTMVGTSTAGTTDTAIKSYIESQYASNSNLTHVLLVGDVAQIPGHFMSFGGGYSGYSGKSDLWYGQISGNDYYNELFVGRFSAENETHVTTQVNKVIHYERDINASDTWLTTGMGIGNNDGPGHFNEKDWEHVENIRTDLLAYNYTEVYQEYPISGYSTSATVMSQHFNSGLSLCNYCNHGSETSWAINGYSNNHVNNLTNVNKLPVIWSVACLNGKYDYSQQCFGETWMRANNSNNPEQPTGAIGGMFSYISQPWQPPQYGQDEMVDILVESYSSNIKRTLGGTSINGDMKILDQYGNNDNSALGTYNTWILYGDPTLTMRNAVPANMGVNHAQTMNTSSSSFTVTATNGNGARATLTRNNEIMGSAIINNGSANITFTAPGQTGTATLTVFGYNKITYVATITITQGTGPDPVSVNVSANPALIARGETSQLSALALGGDGSFTYHWTPATGLNNANIQSPTATPTQTTTYTCTVTSAGLTATGSCTVTVVNAPANLTATTQNNNSVRLNWNPANPADSYIIYRNNVMIAQGITNVTYTDNNLSQGTYSYQVSARYQGIESPKSNTATATIYAPLSVTASATPSIYPLAPGCSTTLRANPVGGNGSYTYNWTPAASVTSPHAQTTTASPGEGLTTYNVSVSSNGQTVQASVTVAVVASPDYINLEIVDDNNVLISWPNATIANYYNVYEYFNGSYSDNELIATNVTGNSFLHENLEDGEHCYYVTAVYQSVEATMIVSDCITIDTFVCYGPEDFTAEYYWDDWEFGTRLMWEKNEAVNMEVTKFRIYRDDELIRELVNVPYTYHYEMMDEDIDLGPHTYVVSAYYQDQDCETFSDPITVEITGVANNMLKADIFPNPTHDNVTIKLDGMKQISLVNSIGQEVFRTNLDADSYTLDMSQFGQGIYVMRIATESGQAVKHIVVE